MRIPVLLIVFGQLWSMPASAQSPWNRTTWPDDIAAARLLGYVSGVQARCPNLEVNKEGMDKFLALGKLGQQDIDVGGRLRGHFDEQYKLAFIQEFDSECAMVLRMISHLLRLRAGAPQPKGDGFISQTIKPIQ